jgi:hypothetical protein
MPVLLYWGVHCLVDARQPRDESWKARAPEPKGSVQARHLGISALERIGGRQGTGPLPALGRRLAPGFRKIACLENVWTSRRRRCAMRF